MVRAPALVLAAFLVSGCAGATDPSATPEPAVEEPTEAPEKSPDATCEDVQGGSAKNFPRFVHVELEDGANGDRITFVFEPDQGAPDKPPLHFLQFTDELLTEGEGAHVEAAGEAFVVISFQAIGVDLSSEKPVEVYTGPKRFTPGFDTLLEVVQLGDFEGQVSWGLGLSHRACVVLDGAADHLTLELQNA